MHTHQTCRRKFLAKAATLVGAPALWAAPERRRPRILLRGSWQSVNIGDIGHTPGALALLARHFPEAQVTLWTAPSASANDPLGHGTRQMLLKAYPELGIAQGSVNKDGQPTTPELAQAWKDADIYLNGSGSGFPGASNALAFHKATGKPVGVFGVSLDPISGFGPHRDPAGGTLQSLRERAMKLPPDHLEASMRTIIDQAAFFYCRDTISRDYLKAQRVKTPVMEFGPDTQLAMTLRDDAKGNTWLRQQGLQAGGFICVIPRLRYTPYHVIRKTKPTSIDREKDAINRQTTEQDHAKLRRMILRYVQETGQRVVICAEMTYQVDLGKEVLWDPLPAEVKRSVVWRSTYWLPDEAAAVYAQAQCVVSVECHSPLIALRQGTPMIHVRQPTDTCKGQMYRDFGAEDWLVEIDETDGDRLWAKLESIHRKAGDAREKVRAIMARVDEAQKQMVATLRQSLP